MITPLMAYFPLIVIFARRYKKDAGIGTVVSMMLPYVLILSVIWTDVLLILGAKVLGDGLIGLGR